MLWQIIIQEILFIFIACLWSFYVSALHLLLVEVWIWDFYIVLLQELLTRHKSTAASTAVCKNSERESKTSKIKNNMQKSSRSHTENEPRNQKQKEKECNKKTWWGPTILCHVLKSVCRKKRVTEGSRLWRRWWWWKALCLEFFYV